jgi:hypothetical protein
MFSAAALFAGCLWPALGQAEVTTETVATAIERGRADAAQMAANVLLYAIERRLGHLR